MDQTECTSSVHGQNICEVSKRSYLTCKGGGGGGGGGALIKLQHPSFHQQTNSF